MNHDSQQVKQSALLLGEYMRGYDDPEDTITVALTHKQTALIGFALHYLTFTPILGKLLGADINTLMNHIGEVGMAQKLGEGEA